MSNMKSVIGFDDNLSNGLQEFAPTSYAVSKMRAARTPYGLNGSVIKDVNDIFKPGLYLLGAGTEHTKNDSYVLTDSDTGYLYFLGPDPDESLKGGHVLTNKREATGVTFREILYMNQGSSNVITTRFGRYIADISNTTSNLGLHHIESIQSLYDTCPADGSKILCWVEDIALWITANRKQDLVEWHPAIRWGAWQSIGTGASGGSGGSPVGGSMSMELLEDSKEATPNTIYVSFGDYTLTLPDPSICSLGDKVRLDQWANTGRVINLDGTIDVTTTPCANGVDQADFTWSGDNIIPDGTIFHHSTEEGLTWSAVANNTTYVIKQVSFLDDAVRYVLTTADSSVILRLCYTEVTYPFVEEAEWANITTLAGGYPIPENVNISDITRGISAAHKVHPVLITIDTDLIGCISYEFELTYDGYNQDPNTKIWVLLKSNDDETVVASIQRMVGNKVVKHTTEIENLWDKVSSLDIDPLISRVSSIENTVIDYISVTSQVYIREHSAAMDYANEIIASAAIDHDNITSAVYSAAKAYTDSQVSPVSNLASANSSRINVTSNKVSATSSSLVALSAVVSSHVNGGHDTGHWTAEEIAGMADLTGVSSILSATSSMAKSTSTTLSSVSSSVSVHINGGKNTGHWTAEQLSSMMPSSAIPGVNTLTAGTTNVIITSGTNDVTGKGDLIISVVQPVKLASSAGGTGCIISEVAGDVGTLDYDRLNLMYDAYKSNTTAQSEWLNDYTVPTAAAVAKLVASRSITIQPGLAGVATLTTNDNRVILSSGSEDEVGQGNITVAVNVSDIESDVEEISSTVSNVSSNLNEAISTVSDISSSLDSTISTVSNVSSSLNDVVSNVSAISSNLDSVISDVSEHINGSNSTGHWTAEEIQGMINAGSAGIAISEGDNVSISTSDVNGITTYYISALTNADSATGDGSTLGIVATLTDIESNNASNSVVPTVRAVYNYGSDILSYTSSVSENASAAISDINSTVNDISEAVLSSAGVHSLSRGTDNVIISSNGTDFTISVNATSVALAQGVSTGNSDISDIAGVVGTLDYQRLTQLYTAAKNGTNLESSWLNDYTVPTAEAVARTIAAAMPSTTSDGSQVSYNDGPIYGFASDISSYVNDVSNIVSNTSSRLGVVSELVSSNDVILSSVSDVAATASTKASAVSSSLLELDSFVSDVSATVSNIDSSLTVVSSTVDSHTDLISSASDLADTASSLAASASDSVSALSDIVDGVSGTVDTVSNTVSAVSSTVDGVSNTVNTVSNTVSSVSSSVSALQSAFDVVSSDHYEVSSALDVAISSASALQEAFDTINIPTSAHIYGGNDTGHWTAGQIQGMIQAGSAGIAISEGANVTIDPITDPDTSITTYYISASPTTYSLCNGSSISGIVVASNNVISTYGNTAETSYVVPTMRAVYNMSSALNSAIGTKQAAGNYASATHSHTIANISDLQTALDGKQAAGDYALSDHSHTIANISGLQDALNGKAATGHNHNGVYATTDHITILSSGDNVTLSSSVNGSQTTYYISASDTSYGSATGNSTTLGVVATVTEVDSDYESNYQVPTVAAVYSYGSAISSYATAVSRAVSNVDSTLSAVSGTVDTVSTTAKNASNTASAAASTANAVSTDFYDTSSVVSNMDDTLDELVIHYNATSDTVSEISSTLTTVVNSATALQTSFDSVSNDFYGVSGSIETIVDSATSLQSSFNAVSEDLYDVSRGISTITDSATSLQTSFDSVSNDFYGVSGNISTIVDSATSLQTSFEAVSTDFYQVSGNISTIEDSATSLQSSFNTVSDTVSEISSTLMSDVIESATSLQTSFEAVSTDLYYVSNDVSVIIDSATSLQSAYDATSNLVSEVSSDFYNTSSEISSHINGGSETGHWTEEELLAKIDTGVTGVAISGVSNISVTNSNVNSINTFYVSAMINGVSNSGISAWVDSQGTYIQGIDATTYIESGGPGTAIFGVVKVAKEYERGTDPFFRGYSNQTTYNPDWDSADSFVPSLKLIHKNYLPKQMAVAVNHEFFSDTSTCAAMRNKYLAWKHGGAVAPIAAHGITEIKNVWSNLSASEINVAASNYGSNISEDGGESSGTRYLFAENCAVPTFHTFVVAISELQTSIGTGGGTPVVVSQGSGITVESSAAGSSMVYKVSGTFCDGTTQVGIVRASNAIVSTASTNAATGSSNTAETKYIVPTMRAVWSMSSALNSAIGTKTSYNLCNGSSITGVVKASNSIISTAGTAGNPETSYIVPTMRAVYNMSSNLNSSIAAKKTVSVVAGDNVSVASSTNGDIVSYIVSCLASGGGPGGSVDLLTSLTAADASVTNKAVTPAAVIGSFINTSMMGFNVGTITPFLNALGFGFYTKNNAYCLDEFKADMSMIDSRLRVKTNGGYFAYPYAQPSCSTYSTNISGLMNNSSHGKYGKAISKYHDAVMNSSEYIEEYLVTDAVSSASFQAQVTALNVVSNPNMIIWKDTCVTLPFGPVISGKTHRFVVEFGRTVPVVAGDDYPHKQYLLKPVDELLYCGLTIINPTKDDHQLYDLIPQYINNIYASDANGVCIQGFNHMFQRVWLVPACNAALQMAYVTIGIEHQAVSTTVSAENCQWPYAGILNDTSFTSTPETGEDGHTGVLEPHAGKVVVSTETGFWNLDAYWGNHANMSQILMSSTDCWYQYGSDYHRTATDAVEEGEDVETTRPPSSAGDTLSDIILNSGTELELVSGVSDKYQSAVNVTINSGASAYVGEGTYMKGVKLHG